MGGKIELGGKITAHFRTAVLGAGGAAAALSVVLDRRDALAAAGRTWPPFVLVAGLLLIGAVANEDGVFAAAGALLDRLPGGDAVLYLAAMGLVAVTTVFLNLDTAAAFLTPVMVVVADKRRAGGARLLYGCVFTANAASLLLPGSNLTNLLVVAGSRLRAPSFFRQMLAPWGLAVAVTAAVVGVAFRSSDQAGELSRENAGSSGPGLGSRRPGGLTVLAIAVAAASILVLPDAALPVAAVGAGLLALRVGQRRLRLGQAAEAIDTAVIAGLFLAAAALGTLARAWSYPMAAMRAAGSVTAAVGAAVASVAVNNLPAAVLLGSRGPAHPVPLLFGLDIGPNLAVTGSLSALVWWRAATSCGVTPSVRRYSAVGVVLVPLSLGAALAAYALAR